MKLPALTEALLRQEATEESFRRGREYHSYGAVLSLGRRGGTIEA